MTEVFICSIVEKFLGVAKIWYPLVQGWHLPPHATPWLRVCLSDRTKYCSVGGYNSNVGEFEVGVPQGSCLGPLLFLIYISILPKATQGNVSMYADNTSLCHMSNDISKLETAINEDLKLLDK